MDHDDRPLGRILNRREMLALMGVVGASVLLDKALGQTTETQETSFPACIVTPEQTEGPYFVDDHLNRSDIRSDTASGLVKEGVALALTLRVFAIGNDSCAPLPGAIVDIWHCDALGVYSDVRDRSFNTVGQTFLRGHQLTDDSGAVRFTTIYPGWYPGRAVHIHFKVRTAQGQELTSQFYFDDQLSEAVYTKDPYASKGPGRLANARDGIYRQGGDQLLLKLSEGAEGYNTEFDIGLYTA